MSNRIAVRGMSRARLGLLALLLAAPLLIGAGLLIGGGDRPVSDDDPPPTPRAESTGTVSGTVTTVTGAPVRDAWVRVEALDEPAPAIPEIGVVTGETGQYEWRLPPGRYDIVISAGESVEARQSATVTAGEATQLDFTLS